MLQAEISVWTQQHLQPDILAWYEVFHVMNKHRLSYLSLLVTVGEKGS